MSNDVLNWAKRLHVGGQTKKAVLLIVADHADEKGRAWPSQESIATVLEMSERTVRSAIAELVEAGILIRKRRWRPDGTRGTDVLKFDMDLVNRQEIPLNCRLPANGAKTTGKCRQNHRQMVPKQPAGAAGKTSQEEPSEGNPQKKNGSEATASGRTALAALPDDAPIQDRCWIEGRVLLIEMGLTAKLAGDMIGQWVKRYKNHGAILEALRAARETGSGSPIPLVVAILEAPEGRARASPKAGRRSSMAAIALKDYGPLQ